MGGVSSKKESAVHTLTPLTQTVLVVRHECRLCFGPSFADKWGFFVDRHLSHKIHSYLDWVEYPKGNHVLEGYTNYVYCGVASKDGCYMFAGSIDGYIFKWDLRTNKLIRQLQSGFGAVNSLAHTPGLLVLAGSDGKTKVWNDEDFTRIRKLKLHSRDVYCLSLNKRGTILVSGSDDGTCGVWSMDNGDLLRVIEAHTHSIQRVLLTKKMIIGGSEKGFLFLWNLESGKELRKYPGGISGGIRDLSLNSDQSMLACCYADAFTIFEYPSMEMMRTIKVNFVCCCFHPWFPNALAVNQDNRSLIPIYCTDTFNPIRIVDGHQRNANSLRFSPDGQRLISVSTGAGTVRVWDVSDLHFEDAV